MSVPAYALRTPAPAQSSGLEELDRALRKVIRLSGLEERAEPNEGELVDEVTRDYDKNRIRWFERGAWHVNGRALGVALAGGEGHGGAMKAAPILEDVKKYLGEIYVVENEAVESRSVWLNEDKSALYFGRGAISNVPLGMIRYVLKTNDLRAIRRWAGAKRRIGVKTERLVTKERRRREYIEKGIFYDQRKEQKKLDGMENQWWDGLYAQQLKEKVTRTPGNETASALVPPPRALVKSEKVSIKGMKDLSYRELIQEILDSTKRTPAEWRLLLTRLLTFHGEDQKPEGVRTPEREMRKVAWERARKFFPRLESIKEMLDRLDLDNMDNIPLYTNRIAVVENKVWEGYEEDKALGVPPQPLPLEGSLNPAEYLHRFRLWFLHRVRQDDYTNLPMAQVGFCAGDETPEGGLGKPTPFGILPVLSVRQAGMKPFYRCFPEFATAILENGAWHIAYISPAPGNPPALRFVFQKPLVDPIRGTEDQAVVVALLQKPLPELPEKPGKAWADMTDEEVFKTALDSMMKEMNQVEFDETVVRSLSFQPEDSDQAKAEKVLTLAGYAFNGRLLPRSNYLLNIVDPAGIDRYTRFGTRTEENRQAMRLLIQMQKTRGGWHEAHSGRSLPTADEKEKFQRRLENRREALDLLIPLQASRVMLDSEGVQRAEQMAQKLGFKGNPFIPSPKDPYLPIWSLPFIRRPDGGWLLSDLDMTAFLNRLEGSSLLKDTSLGQRVHELADGLQARAQAVFLAEVNHAALRGLLSKPFRDTPMEKVDQALLGRSTLFFGLDGLSLTTLSLRRAEQQALLEKIRSAQERILAAVEFGLGESVDKTLPELERAAEGLSKTGPLIPVLELRTLRLKDRSAYKADLEALQSQVKGWVDSQTDGTAEDPVRLDLFRRLVSVHDQAASSDPGQLQRALEKLDHLLPQLRGEEIGRLEKVQSTLGGRLFQQVEAELQQLAADGEIFEKAGRVQEVLKSSTTIDGLLPAAQVERIHEAQKDLAKQFAIETVRHVETLPDRNEEEIVLSIARLNRAIETIESFNGDFAEGLISKRDKLERKLEGLRKRAEVADRLKQERARLAIAAKQERELKESLGEKDARQETAQAILNDPQFKELLSTNRVIHEFLEEVSKGTHPSGARAWASAKRQLGQDQVKQDPTLFQFYTAVKNIAEQNSGLEEFEVTLENHAVRIGPEFALFLSRALGRPAFTQFDPAGLEESLREAA